ncbi:efflux RND transporter periplasmic adaptor subunit [Archangium lipolyticum]|uniref:efflux RND transporter periplasmic adaptor subunit n=1 Tax=Archangium lipolyticum TaxID=2970465 RepID=UPI002149EECA|nr:efflux RND transporter periplasmic adaptor subunit [Archangium lipolyticum]
MLLSVLAGVWVRRLAETTPPPASTPPPGWARKAPAADAPDGSADGFLGVIVARQSVDLAPVIEGRVESVRVQVGERVSRGDIIATLDTRAMERELAIAEAELLEARADEQVATHEQEEARERLKRREQPQQRLTGAVSEEELATARYQERVATAKQERARAQVQQKEARVRQCRQRIEDATLVAPFDGLVASRLVDPGALVSSGRPIIHLLRAAGREVRFAIPEQRVLEVRVGQRVHVAVQGHEVTLGGQVHDLSPEVDVAARVLFGTASLEEPEGSPLPSGTVVRVSLVRESGNDGGVTAP